MASRSLKNRPAVRKSHPGVTVAGIAIMLLSVLSACGAASLALIGVWLSDLPDYRDLSAYDFPEPSVIYASDGETVLAEFQLENREPVELNQISPLLVQATIAIEDERFYQHAGVDVIAIARAVVNNCLGGQLEGASTITQQYVRNTVLSGEMTDISLKRKVREAYVAVQLERLFDKDEILLKYLNTINYGSGSYGAQAASQRYFSKDAADLSVAEAATLAAIPQSPSFNNPLDYPDSCLARRNLVLERMCEVGYITREECDAAQAEPLGLNPSEVPDTGILRFPYFTSYVRNCLTDTEGEYVYTADQLHRGGLRIYTTLDVSAQLAAEGAAAEKQWEANAAAGTDGVFECALVAIEPSTGYIKALVGGSDFSKSQVNLATGEGGSGRQAGSAFKTFTLVAAIEQGVDPETLIDASSTVNVPGSGPVSNINGNDYGTRSIASAFAVSSNTAFVRLILSLGPDSVIDVAHRMGIQADLPRVAGITLGTQSVTPLEMASAYATLASGGIYCEPECIERIEDSAGNVLMDNTAPSSERVLPIEVAYAAVRVMRGVVEHGTGYEAALGSGQSVAGKTGTSDRYLDSWFCGITPQLSVSIWLGDRSDYVDAQSIPEGVTATSAFASFAGQVLAGWPIQDFEYANDPVYRKYVDFDNHIGAWYGSSKEEDDDEKNDEKDDAGDGAVGDSAAVSEEGESSDMIDEDGEDAGFEDDQTNGETANNEGAGPESGEEGQAEGSREGDVEVVDSGLSSGIMP